MRTFYRLTCPQICQTPMKTRSVSILCSWKAFHWCNCAVNCHYSIRCLRAIETGKRKAIIRQQRHLRRILFEKPLKAADNTVPNLIALLAGQKYVQNSYAKADGLTYDCFVFPFTIQTQSLPVATMVKLSISTRIWTLLGSVSEVRVYSKNNPPKMY